MRIKLTRAGAYEDVIRGFRQEICRKIGIDPNGSGVSPLPHGFYVFGCTEELRKPGGMAEFFFYDSAFTTYSTAVYNAAYDLSQVGPMHEMIHVRSLIIDEEHRNSRLFMHLCASFLESAYDMGARYMTTSTNAGYDYVLGLHKNAGMQKLGVFMLDGAPQQLSLLELEPVALRAKHLRHRHGTEIEEAVQAEMQQRMSAAAGRRIGAALAGAPSRPTAHPAMAG